MEKIIDAKNKIIGRVATEAAMALMGKDNPNYQPNILADVTVVIENASLSKINDKKLGDKVYTRYTGYPSGLKFRTLEELIAKKGYQEVYEKAVYGMLPSNRLRKQRMKNLTIKD